MWLIYVLIIGAIAGWLAGRLVKGYGFGLIGNIVIGIAGAFIAQLLFPRIGLGFGGGALSAILRSTVGAVLLLLVVRLIQRR
ncbi:MAG: GlsB/YeaQ/YmgE family stress response membrane protein [bacterium]